MASKMKCSRLDVVWDQYDEISLKAATRVSRGAGARRPGLPQKGASETRNVINLKKLTIIITLIKFQEHFRSNLSFVMII